MPSDNGTPPSFQQSATPGLSAVEAVTPAFGASPLARAKGSQDPALSSPSESPPSVALPFSRVVDCDVRSLAIGKKHHAVLCSDGAAFFSDRGAWQAIPLPEQFRKGALHAEIYIGRDDRPRLMGDIDTPEGSMPIYLRHRGQWKAAFDEIGKLGSRGSRAGGRLYGVLGWDDPEVVCRDGNPCIKKTVAGWSSITNPGYSSMWLSGSTVWAQGESGVVSLGAKGWSAPSGLPAGEVRHIWGDPESEAWAILERGDVTLIARRGGEGWKTLSSPIAKPTRLGGLPRSAVWLVGSSGAARFDGEKWSVVESPAENLTRIGVHPSGDVWLGGHSGLWYMAAEARESE